MQHGEGRVETKVRENGDDIIDFKMPFDQGVKLSGKGAVMSVEDFFKGCDSRIDVILDPQCDGHWFPQREKTRSMAPQFKSKGQGYIRLGDDMSKNGVAFMSGDECETFFSSKNCTPTNEETDGEGGGNGNGDDFNNINMEPPVMEKQQSHHSQHWTKSQSQSISQQQQQQTQSQLPEYQSDSDEDEFNDVGDAGKLLRELQDADTENATKLKWHERVDLITKLGKSASTKKGREHAGSSLTLLQDIMNARNVNVHVLRASVVSIGRIGWGLKTDLVSQASFRTVFMEVSERITASEP